MNTYAITSATTNGMLLRANHCCDAIAAIVAKSIAAAAAIPAAPCLIGRPSLPLRTSRNSTELMNFLRALARYT